MNEWKEFVLSSLPDLTQPMEFMKKDSDGEWCLWELYSVEAVCELEQGEEILYRLKPRKKTDEELAEEYAENENYPKGDYGYDAIRKSFLAGHASKEGER